MQVRFVKCMCWRGGDMRKIIIVIILTTFFLNSVVSPICAQEYMLGQDAHILPKPGVMLNPSQSFIPPLLKGIKIYPENPFRFDFIIDSGDSLLMKDSKNAFKQEATKLIKYFLAALTVPEDDLWVNLSPYEKDRIIPDAFGNTVMGRDLLAQDYILKQVSASLIDPQKNLGKDFWDKVYAKAQAEFGTTDVPVDTFNKVWVVPETAGVYEDGDRAIVVDTHLKVMLEVDYLAFKNNHVGAGEVHQSDKINKISSAVIREIILPEIEKEVNEGKNFAPLRQVYCSLILATWFKRSVQKNFLSGAYVGQNKVSGVEFKGPQNKDKIYAMYLDAFKKGVFNFIREEKDPADDTIMPRKYFSGGAFLKNVELSPRPQSQVLGSFSKNGKRYTASAYLDPQGFDSSQTDMGKRKFMKGVLATAAMLLVAPGSVLSAIPDMFEKPNIRKFLSFFDVRSNPVTGFSLSHYGDGSPSGMTYDQALRAILGAGGQNAGKIIKTYSKNVTVAAGENAPATMNANYSPAGGVFNNIRVAKYNEPNWWDRWEFKVSAGDNAWIGMAALQHYVKTSDPVFLRFAIERADFLIKLQDADGGLHYGPRGQFIEGSDLNRQWNAKSTEANESALYFFDMLFAATRKPQYKKVADNIYNYLISKMYDPLTHTFARGESYQQGQWRKDAPEYFVPDIISWAPMERMLADPRFGKDRLERLRTYEMMIGVAERERGVYDGTTFKGVTFPYGRNAKIVHIEWSSQFALRYLRLAQEYRHQSSAAKDMTLKRFYKSKEDAYQKKYQGLVASLGSYFKEKDGGLVAPYAVYINGLAAAHVPTDLGWNTPGGYASVASTYYVFALTRFDPLLLGGGSFDNATAEVPMVTPVVTGMEDANTLTMLSKERGSVKVSLGGREMPFEYPVSYMDGLTRQFVDPIAMSDMISRTVTAMKSEDPAFHMDSIDKVQVVENSVDPNTPNNVLSIPFQLLVPVGDLRELNTEIGVEVAEPVREELLMLAIKHGVNKAAGDSPDQLEIKDLRYLGRDNAQFNIPYYPNAKPADYNIVIPVFNEAVTLDFVLKYIKKAGYLHKVTFVNDASTDGSKEILDAWKAKEGIEVVHMVQNKKKEGAIRDVLEMFQREGRLTEKTILLDAESLLESSHKDQKLEDLINQAAAYMDDQDISGLAFQYDIYLPEKPSFLQKAQYSDFVSMRFVNRLLGKTNKLWVLNGRGGMFRSDRLLAVLQNMVPDFETGDLLVTVNLMKSGYKVAYFNNLNIVNMDEDTYKDYFKQRRRWARGTTKVVVNEKGFYVKEIKEMSRLGIVSVMNTGMRIALLAGLGVFPLAQDPFMAMLVGLPVEMAIFTAISCLYSISDANARRDGAVWKALKWSLLNALLYSTVTITARLMGFFDAVRFFIKNHGSEVEDPYVAVPLSQNKIVAADQGSAVIKKPVTKELGGVDFNPQNLQIKTSGKGSGLKLLACE